MFLEEFVRLCTATLLVASHAYAFNLWSLLLKDPKDSSEMMENDLPPTTTTTTTEHPINVSLFFQSLGITTREPYEELSLFKRNITFEKEKLRDIDDLRSDAIDSDNVTAVEYYDTQYAIQYGIVDNLRNRILSLQLGMNTSLDDLY